MRIWLSPPTLLGLLAGPWAGACPGWTAEPLEGEWTARAAERDGRPAPDVVGHRLRVTGERFTIEAAPGRPLFAGTLAVDFTAAPASVDFHHAQGELTGRTWLGIFAREGEVLRICDNAGDPARGRPARLVTTPGSGHVLVEFARVAP